MAQLNHHKLIPVKVIVHNYYLDNGDGSYTIYVYNARDNTTQAIVVYSKDDIPIGYKEGIFIQEEKI